MAKTITSANSVFMLAITGLYGVPIALDGYAADDAFTTDPQSTVEATMGVDGHMSVGYVPNFTKMKVKFAADSNSIAVFDAWKAAQDRLRDVYLATAIITLTGNGAKYVLTNGALTSAKVMPDNKKVLQPQEYEITWESITKASV